MSIKQQFPQSLSHTGCSLAVSNAMLPHSQPPFYIRHEPRCHDLRTHCLFTCLWPSLHRILGASLPLHGYVGCPLGLSPWLAPTDNQTRQCNSVRQASPQDQRHLYLSGRQRHPCPAHEDCGPASEVCNRACPSSQDEDKALTSSYPRKVVGNGRSWICEF